MKPKVLITAKIHPIAKEILQDTFDVTAHEEDSLLTTEELKKAVTIYDGILTTFYDRIDKEILDCATRTKIISNYAVGLDNIDVAYAKTKNIEVFHLPDIVTNSTADMTFALLLSWARQIISAEKYVKEGGWKVPILQRFQGEELSGKTFGILGYGRIGRAVAQRAFGFGMNVICAYRRKLSTEDLFENKVKQVDIETFYKTVDYLSLHVPLTDETKRMIGTKEFEKMDKKPLILNLARGAVIDTSALLSALEKEQIRGIATDVTDPEPLPKDHPLLKFKNCLVVPHIGTSTQECRKLMAKTAAMVFIKK